MEPKGNRYLTEYRGRPADLLRDLAETAGSERLRKAWTSNIRKMTSKGGA
jgi:hypothetical protein